MTDQPLKYIHQKSPSAGCCLENHFNLSLILVPVPNVPVWNGPIATAVRLVIIIFNEINTAAEVVISKQA